LDKFDQKILSLLKQNARQSVSSIAEQVHLSRTSVADRIKRMEERGDILGYQVMTPAHSTKDTSLKAFFEIKHGGYQCANLPELLLKYPQVKHCYGMSGAVDLLIYLEFSEMETLHTILDVIIAELPERATVLTHMIIQEWC
jgi:Lrp/AsnC family leucine-responsive transcriptional regulator